MKDAFGDVLSGKMLLIPDGVENFELRCPEIKLNSRMAMEKSDEVWETHDILSGPDSFLYFCVGLK